MRVATMMWPRRLTTPGSYLFGLTNRADVQLLGVGTGWVVTRVTEHRDGPVVSKRERFNKVILACPHVLTEGAGPLVIECVNVAARPDDNRVTAALTGAECLRGRARPVGRAGHQVE